ncbi:DUF3667 domain-containing protein [Sphingomonas sp. Mn802worker]|uniref:DUF3667 domain-containing protein n=1 Tax=Sphingomonas sp. Mn802worker TaxID=629773 RepID=UPI00035E99C7|nr:DUF3667 domain-containing protein [Sphingomonas sp. Mn802worker]
MVGEMAADVVTGGIVAHAVEPRAGGHVAASQFEHGLCLNCGTALIDAHCHRCGQAGHVHRTAGAFFHDVLHGVFHFEGKAWRTLPMLVLHPGALTRRYVAGERARFVSPIALFLFSVFLLFAILAQLPMFHFKGDFLKGGGGIATLQSTVAIERGKIARDLPDLRRELSEEHAAPKPDAARIAKLEKRINDARTAVNDLTAAERALPRAAEHSNFNAAGPGFENWVAGKLQHAKENPKLLLYKLKSSGYKYSWALIPLSLPFLWLLFPFSRRFGFYDHAVFATYSLTFMSLLTIVTALLLTAGVSSSVVILALAAAMVHIYKQLKGAYSLSRGGALIRTLVLSTFICWAIVPLFLTGLLYLGVAD